MKRAGLLLVLAAAAAACAGGPGAGPEPADPAAAAALEATPDAVLQHAQLQSGTAYRDGVLAAFCHGTSCEEESGARPAGSIQVADSGLVMFIVGAAPTAGSAAVRYEGETILRRRLQPGAIMPLQTALPPGRYRVVLKASWGERSARWLFGLRVPD